MGGLRDATRRVGERVTECRGGVLAAAAVVVAVTKALEEGEDAQTHAMILAPSANGWPECEAEFMESRRQERWRLRRVALAERAGRRGRGGKATFGSSIRPRVATPRAR